jgi:hypothetical protein
VWTKSLQLRSVKYLLRISSLRMLEYLRLHRIWTINDGLRRAEQKHESKQSNTRNNKDTYMVWTSSLPKGKGVSSLFSRMDSTCWSRQMDGSTRLVPVRRTSNGLRHVLEVGKDEWKSQLAESWLMGVDYPMGSYYIGHQQPSSHQPRSLIITCSGSQWQNPSRPLKYPR